MDTIAGQPDLGTGVTELNLNIDGKILSSGDCLNKTQSGYAKIDLSSNKKVPERRKSDRIKLNINTKNNIIIEIKVRYT